MTDAQRALVRECDLADSNMRKWVRVPVKHVREALAFEPTTLPSVEDVARALAARWWTTQTGETEPWESLTHEEQTAVIENNALDQIAPAVLALFPGRTEAEVMAEGWDEGFADGYRQHAEGEDGPRFTNPYREEADRG